MIRPFEFRDLEQINEWYVLQGEKPVEYEFLPKIGRIEWGVAAGFLSRTDSAFCLIEGYVTNPNALPEYRHRALYDITMSLIGSAKDLGFKNVIAVTRDPNIMERAIMHGFSDLGNFRLFTKEL